ncbi:unnamed protein product, partial [Ceratitis capitata]
MAGNTSKTLTATTRIMTKRNGGAVNRLPQAKVATQQSRCCNCCFVALQRKVSSYRREAGECLAILLMLLLADMILVTTTAAVFNAYCHPLAARNVTMVYPKKSFSKNKAASKMVDNKATSREY